MQVAFAIASSKFELDFSNFFVGARRIPAGNGSRIKEDLQSAGLTFSLV